MNLLETYLRELREIRSSGSAVRETSYYPALANLLNRVGTTLKPRVRCVINVRNQGAGIPDGGLFTPDQYASDDGPTLLQIPGRGVIEAKGTNEDVREVARSEQVLRYLNRYGQVLVTNFLGRSLTGAEAREVRDMVRRIAAIRLLEPLLDENYAAVKRSGLPLDAAG